MPFTYILQSLKDKKFYIGSTNDIKRRKEEHDLGKVKATRYRRPLKIIYTEEYTLLIDARRREFEIKRMKGGVKFKALIAGVVHW